VASSGPIRSAASDEASRGGKRASLEPSPLAGRTSFCSDGASPDTSSRAAVTVAGGTLAGAGVSEVPGAPLGRTLGGGAEDGAGSEGRERGTGEARARATACEGRELGTGVARARAAACEGRELGTGVARARAAACEG